MFILAIIGIIYGALVAMVQPNLKKLVACPSSATWRVVEFLGIFAFQNISMQGAVFQMLAKATSRRTALGERISISASANTRWAPF